MSSSSPIMTLSEQSLQTLLSRGDDARLENGFRLVKTNSYMSVDSPTTVAIPNELESVETLQFLELCPEAAQFVFHRFLQRKAQFPDWADILTSAKDHVESIEGDAFDESDWIGVMNRIGLTTNYQTRIMDPNYSHMRLTGSVKHWAIEAMTMRFEFLESLDKTIKRHNQSPNPVSHINLSGQLKYGPPHLVPEGPSNEGPAVGTFATSGPLIASSTNWPPVEIDGHQILYKGGCLARLNRIYRENNLLNIYQISSTSPDDFAAYSVALYLTKQAQSAWEYAQWTKNLVDDVVVPVGILAIAVPDNLLSSIAEVVGDEWRKRVWSSRREDLDLDDTLDCFQWLTGPLCRQTTDKIKGMGNPAELEIWKLSGGETASQHCTASKDMLRMLNKTCVGKVWITEMAWVKAKQ